MGITLPVAGAALALSLVVGGPLSGLASAQVPDDAVPRLAPEATAVEACRAVFDQGAFDGVPSQGLLSPQGLVSFNLPGLEQRRECSGQVTIPPDGMQVGRRLADLSRPPEDRV